MNTLEDFYLDQPLAHHIYFYLSLHRELCADENGDFLYITAKKIELLSFLQSLSEEELHWLKKDMNGAARSFELLTELEILENQSIIEGYRDETIAALELVKKLNDRPPHQPFKNRLTQPSIFKG